ncbi:MAG: uncharacterized protein PWR10_2371 [Halanaerobiales bacterium]|nr:uncharacterized protein [Halanaerobiales bacterium]
MYQDKIPFQIIDKYSIELLLLFGSYADNTSHQNSDLDLGYMSKEILTREKELDLLTELMQFYQKGDIDLVDLKKATPALKVEIANRGKLLYGREDVLLNFQLYAAARYADTCFLRREREKYLKERVRNL